MMALRHAAREAGNRFLRVWAMALLIAITWYYGTGLLASITPASAFLEVRSVWVADTPVGMSPIMQVDRRINADFPGDWTADVERQEEPGRFVIECTASGHGNYSTENDLPLPGIGPKRLNLNWWTWPINCTPDEPGFYRVETTWTIKLPGGLSKEVRAVSNVFEVTG